MLSSSSCSKNTEDSSTAAYVQYNLVLEVLRIVLDSFSVGLCAISILEHLFVDVEIGVATKVVVVLLRCQINCELLLKLSIIKPIV